MANASRFQGDATALRLPCRDFQCGETVEEGGVEDFSSSVTFYCSLPDRDERLVFRCREPSCGVLIGGEPVAQKEEDGAMDPNFFDPGYSLAGKTGFQVWPGSRILVEALIWPQPPDCLSLKGWQSRMVQDTPRVLELGAGVGVVGSCLASAGAHVLLTDLPTLVTDSILPNLARNENRINQAEENGEPPEWLTPVDAVRIGKGWVGAKSLNWTIPIEKQLPFGMYQHIDLIIASDCVWLVSMFNALLSTVTAIFEASPGAKLLMSFQRRDPVDGDSSVLFTSVDRVLEEVQTRNWTVDCLAWHPVVYEWEEDKEVFVFEISPARDGP